MKTLDCGHKVSPQANITPGYGLNSKGETSCYKCCAAEDLSYMRKQGKITLYLSNKEITNWPGSLRFPVHYIRTGKHNIAGKRYDAWFMGPDKDTWHGVQYGDNTQLIHCKRIKPASGAQGGR